MAANSGKSQPAEMETIDCKASFVANLTQYFKSDSLSDVTLVVENQRFPTHKLILAASSTYFQRMFYGGDWKEGKGRDVKLEETPACREVFPTFLQYFYSGSVSVNRQTVVPLVTLADKYDVNVLKEHCSQFMTNLINQADIEGALAWLAFSEQLSMKHLAHRCLDIICFNFEKASSFPSWLSLSLGQIIAILKRSDLIVPSEYTVYLAVHSWLMANENALDKLSDILAHIQFKSMTIQELMKVEQSHLASSSTNSSVREQINSCILAGFRHVAIAKEGIDIATDGMTDSQHIHLSRSSMQKATISDGYFALRPTCHWSSEPRYYQWQLSQCNVGKFRITLPSITRTKPFQSFDFSGGLNPSQDSDIFSQGGFGTMGYPEPPTIQSQTLYLKDDLPGTIRLKLLITFCDSNSVIHHVINHSVDTTIPQSNGGTLVELPSLSNISDPAKDLFIPDDIYYSFEILKQN